MQALVALGERAPVVDRIDEVVGALGQLAAPRFGAPVGATFALSLAVVLAAFRHVVVQGRRRGGEKGRCLVLR